jgi:hypothetical protein
VRQSTHQDHTKTEKAATSGAERRNDDPLSGNVDLSGQREKDGRELKPKALPAERDDSRCYQCKPHLALVGD